MKVDTGKITMTGDGNDYNGVDFGRHVGDLLIDKMLDKKNTKWYDMANVTFEKECGFNVDCLAELYGFSEKEAYKANAKNNTIVLAGSAVEDVIIALIPGSIVVNDVKVSVTQMAGGGKLIYDIYGTKNGDDSRKIVYPLMVAMIESERSTRAHYEYNKSRDLL